MIRFAWLFVKVCAGQFLGVCAVRGLDALAPFLTESYADTLAFLLRTFVLVCTLWLLRNVEIVEERFKKQTEYEWPKHGQ